MSEDSVALVFVDEDGKVIFAYAVPADQATDTDIGLIAIQNNLGCWTAERHNYSDSEYLAWVEVRLGP